MLSPPLPAEPAARDGVVADLANEQRTTWAACVRIPHLLPAKMPDTNNDDQQILDRRATSGN